MQKRSDGKNQNAEKMGKELDHELGESKAKQLLEDLAAVIAKHSLVQSPETCRRAFLYMISVIEGWNSL